VLAELTRLEPGWLLAAPLAATVAAQGLLAGRRRTQLNEALHELRRPLQALVLAAAPARSTLDGGWPGEADLSAQAALALQRLDREINGGAEPEWSRPVDVGELLDAAVQRWRGRAAQDGVSLALRGACPAAFVGGYPGALAQALDNLIVNAIEHGGAEILVAAELAPAVVRITVADSGGATPTGRRMGGARRAAVALSGRRRHGHGLRVVRRVAAAHRGEFRLCRVERGTEAVLELPLATDGGVG
jgi:signal transduction histidine kinase